MTVYTGTLHNFNITSTLADYVVPVNINNIAPGNYKMQMTYTNITAMVRESSGVTFPYNSTGNEISITAGANGSGTAQTTSSYYWFYNWIISSGCFSNRVPVLATVTSSPSVTASANITAVCNGGSVTLTATSSNPNYTYTWTPGNITGSSITVNPTATTTYLVNAQDNTGCAAIDEVDVNVLPASATVTTSTTEICVSDSRVLSLNPSTGYGT